ncbi:hypothetical protein BS638_13835, partial [Clostridium tepidum]
TSIYFFSEKIIFKNKVSNILIIINIFLPIIMSALLDYSVLFKIFNLQYLKMFLGTIVIWLIAISFNSSLKKIS